ncbi:MAG: glycerate kinase [Spirosomataceae bacterium]
MNLLIAPDKFKDALSAAAVGEALAQGIGRSFPAAQCRVLPLADGGEGSLEVLKMALHGEYVSCEVHDPLFRKIPASYLWIEANQTAIVEMARASGIELLRPEERNCLITTSLGTGELIRHALDKGARHITLTVGGTATNDAGMGMAAALGFEFLDAAGEVLSPIGQHLGLVQHIRTERVHPALSQARIQVATDVTNPFAGSAGAAYVFARQKGANDAGIAQLDQGLQHVAGVFRQQLGKSVDDYVGAGAGGGIAGGACCLLNANIQSATDWILETLSFEQHLQWADVLLTGEGKIDSQSWDGKLVSRLLAQAERHHKPVILVCGTLQQPEKVLEFPSVWYATSVLKAPVSLETALHSTRQLLEKEGLLLGRLLSKFWGW